MRRLQNNTKYCQTNQNNTVPGQIFVSPPISLVSNSNIALAQRQLKF